MMSAINVEVPGPAISFQAYATAGHQMQRCCDPASPCPQRGQPKNEDLVRCQGVFFIRSGSRTPPFIASERGCFLVPSMRSKSHFQGAVAQLPP